jgi:hypothetical protein
VNVKARHARRHESSVHPWHRHACWCPIHRGGNKPRGEGHAFSFGAAPLYAPTRHVAPDGMLATGPWYDEDGRVVDNTISTSEPLGFSKSMRITKRLRSIRREVAAEKKALADYQRNPKMPSRMYRRMLPEWQENGVDISGTEPVYTARLA